MSDENETQDSNLEEDQDLYLEDESTEQTDDALAKAETLAENQKIRAEKAEKKLKALEANKETETPKKEETKSNEPDYARLAFLEGKDVKHPDDQKIVMDEAKRLNLPLTDIIGMEHIKSKLKVSNDQREAEEGAPKGKGKAGGAGPQDVEYHLAKGTTPDDLELAEKVINAKMKQETNSNMFSEELFTG